MLVTYLLQANLTLQEMDVCLLQVPKAILHRKHCRSPNGPSLRMISDTVTKMVLARILVM